MTEIQTLNPNGTQVTALRMAAQATGITNSNQAAAAYIESLRTEVGKRGAYVEPSSSAMQTQSTIVISQFYGGRGNTGAMPKIA